MPVISTNDIALHKQLKHEAISNDLTVGQAVEKAVRFALAIGLLKKNRQEILDIYKKLE